MAKEIKLKGTKINFKTKDREHKKNRKLKI